MAPLDLTNLVFERIERLNPVLNAYVTLTKEQALADAGAVAKEIENGRYRGPLHGVPVSIKDNIAIKGVRTTAGSKTLSEWKPDHDATVVTRLRAAGAVILGKTHMHEWAKSSHTNNVFYGPSRNPWDVTRATGGSSGGSAAAVAASLGLASIGTDSAGSVRNPAALCGIAGLKATHGRVSLSGGVPGTGPGSINHFGVLAKTVEDCALVLNCVAGADPQDPYCAELPVPDYTRDLAGGADGLRVGLVRGYFDALMFDEVRQVFDEAVRFLGSLGVETEEVEISHMEASAGGAGLHRPRGGHAGPRSLPAHSAPGLQSRYAEKPHRLAAHIRQRRQHRAPGPAAHLRRIRARLRAGPGNGGAHHFVPRAHHRGAGPGLRAHRRPGGEALGPPRQPLYAVHDPVQPDRAAGPQRVLRLFPLRACPSACRSSAGPFDEETVLRVGHAYERAAGWYKRTPEFRDGR